jgi:hypothetical protein
VRVRHTCTATELGEGIEWREESSASELVEAVPLAGAAAAVADDKCGPCQSCSGSVPRLGDPVSDLKWRIADIDSAPENAIIYDSPVI